MLAAEPGAPGAAARVDVESDVDILATAALELAAPALAKRSIVLQVEIEPGLRASIAPDQLAQVLGNLLQNAARYTPDGGRVVVGAQADEDGVTIRVGNSGLGIPAADLPRIWERFYRVEKSRDRERGGAGVGLSIVRQLVEAAGGRVGAATANGWTEVTAWVPAAR